MSKAITAKTFVATLSNAVRSIKSMRGKVQELIAFAVTFYASEEGNGNTIYLTKIMQAATQTAGLNTRGIQAYIQEAANVQWTKDKDGNGVFKKANKGAEVTVNSNVLAIAWYDWVVENLSSNNAKSDWSMAGYALTVIKTLKRHEVGVVEFKRALQEAADAA